MLACEFNFAYSLFIFEITIHKCIWKILMSFCFHKRLVPTRIYVIHYKFNQCEHVRHCNASFTPNSFTIRPYTFQHKLQNGLKRAILLKCFCKIRYQYVFKQFSVRRSRLYSVHSPLVSSSGRVSHQFTSWGRRFQTVQVRLQCVGTRSDPVVPRSHYAQFRSN